MGGAPRRPRQPRGEGRLLLELRFQLFAFPGHPAFGVLDFEGYLSRLVLDSDQTNPVEGVETAWLEGR